MCPASGGKCRLLSRRRRRQLLPGSQQQTAKVEALSPGDSLGQVGPRPRPGTSLLLSPLAWSVRPTCPHLRHQNRENSENIVTA